jgi:hypothetical protein
MIETRAREASRRALLEVQAIELPDVEAVISQRHARHRARVARVSAGVVVLIALVASVAVVARHDSSKVNVSGPPPTTVSPAPGLTFSGFHAQQCDEGEMFQAVYGCSYVLDSGTSADVARASARDSGTNGWVVDLTLTPSAATRFAKNASITASIDGVQVGVTRVGDRVLVLAGAGGTPWDANAANAVAARITATR